MITDRRHRAFFVPLKVTALVGFVVALPTCCARRGRLSPRLSPREKAGSAWWSRLPLFLAEWPSPIFWSFPVVFRFMAAVAREAWRMTDIDKYFSFVLSTFIAGVTRVPSWWSVLGRAGVVRRG
jgi:Sec-independent protein secretion pathway component TatC